MEFLNNFIGPVSVAAFLFAAGGIYKWGKNLYLKTQERITDLELRMHKRELSVRLGGLTETNNAVKEFFAAYDFLYQQSKDKSAERFIDKIDAMIAAAQRTNEASAFSDALRKAIIAVAEESGYQRKFTAAEAETEGRVYHWQNALPDKIEITLADSAETK